MTCTQNLAIDAALFVLELDRVITYSRIEDDGERVVVSLPTSYLGDDPNRGYDGETEARGRKIDDALAECGLCFWDAGCEEGGEYWVFVARS